MVDCIMTAEVLNEMKQFQLFVPLTNKSQPEVKYTENSDGTLMIEGTASTTNKDLQGDIILPSAIRSMKEQLLTTTRNLHGDHRYGLDGIYGAIKEVLDSSDDSLEICAQLRKSKSPEIKEMLDIGVNLGLSIGGKITEYTILEDHGWEIKDLRLMEISLTGMPANWDTYGTIQESTDKSIVKANCLAGACHVIRKNLDFNGEFMTKKEEPNKYKEETAEFSKDDAVDLFNELMASKQDEIVSEIASETVKQVTKEIPALVKAEFEKLKDSSSNNDDEGNEEDEETEKKLKDLIENTVKSSMEDSMGKLFKELGDNRDPKFHVDDVTEKDLQDEEPKDEGMTSKQIAEQMFANQSQDEFIRALLNQD